MTLIDPIRWTVHPVRRKPRTGVIMSLLSCCLLVGVHLRFDDWFLTLLAGALYMGALRTFFFPLRFEVSEVGASRRDILVTTRLAWQDVREVRSLPQGIQLVGFRKKMLLPCPETLREEVQTLVTTLTATSKQS